MHAGRVSFQVRLRSWLTVTIFRVQIGCKILVSVEHELQTSILMVRRSPPVPSSFELWETEKADSHIPNQVSTAPTECLQVSGHDILNCKISLPGTDVVR